MYFLYICIYWSVFSAILYSFSSWSFYLLLLCLYGGSSVFACKWEIKLKNICTYTINYLYTWRHDFFVFVYKTHKVCNYFMLKFLYIINRFTSDWYSRLFWAQRCFYFCKSALGLPVPNRRELFERDVATSSRVCSLTGLHVHVLYVIFNLRCSSSVEEEPEVRTWSWSRNSTRHLEDLVNLWGNTASPSGGDCTTLQQKRREHSSTPFFSR